MSQLARSTCRHCEKTIGSILDGQFCPACGAAYHHRCKNPGLQDGTTRTCSACGCPLPRQTTSAPAPQSLPPLPTFGQTVRFVRTIRIALAGCGVTLLGCLLLFVPDLRHDSTSLSATEMLYGLVLLGIGVVLLAAAVWSVLMR
jgi:hypothetical protein